MSIINNTQRTPEAQAIYERKCANLAKARAARAQMGGVVKEVESSVENSKITPPIFKKPQEKVNEADKPSEVIDYANNPRYILQPDGTYKKRPGRLPLERDANGKCIHPPDSFYKIHKKKKRSRMTTAQAVALANYKAKHPIVKQLDKKVETLTELLDKAEKVVEKNMAADKPTPIFVNGEEVKQDDVESPKVSLELSPRQGEALEAKEKFVLYGGAKGGGKSWFLCVWVFLKAMQNKRNKVFFCRRRAVDFNNTTLETWKKAIPANMYKINEQKKKIFIPRSGSVIDYGGLDDPLLIQALNSAEYGHIGGDQAEEFDRDSFAMMRGTLRHKLEGGVEPHYQIMLTANPAQCWLKELFILDTPKDFRFIQALPTDNPFLASEYVSNLADAFKHRPNLLAAYLHGSWDDLSSDDVCIQPTWLRGAIKREVNGPVTKRIVVNDPARFGDDENVIYVLEQTSDGKVRLAEEHYLNGKSTMETAGRLTSIRKRVKANMIAVDVIGLGAGVVDALNELGEPVYPINSSSKPTTVNNEKKYYNLRSQMWLEAGDKFADGLVSLPEGMSLTSQLTTVRFDFVSNGRRQVESKDEIKKRIGRSPDRGDTLVMGLYAIDKAETLDYYERVEAETDRVGRGVPLEVERNEYSMNITTGYESLGG